MEFLSVSDGYGDPIAVFETVYRELEPKLIVFHGICSAVPVLARVALRKVGCTGYLIPNLSRGLAEKRIDEIA